MTTKDEALKQALDALDEAYGELLADSNRVGSRCLLLTQLEQAIAKGSEALAQKDEQEPVAWGVFYFGGKSNRRLYSQCDTQEQAKRYIADRHQSDGVNTFHAAPLYTAPPKRKPLTEDSIADIWNTYCDEMGNASIEDAEDITRAIELAHGIRGKK